MKQDPIGCHIQTVVLLQSLRSASTRSSAITRYGSVVLEVLDLASDVGDVSCLVCRNSEGVLVMIKIPSFSKELSGDWTGVGTRVELRESDGDVAVPRDAHGVGSQGVVEHMDHAHVDGAGLEHEASHKKLKMHDDTYAWNALHRVLSQKDLMAFDDGGDELVKQLLTSPSGGLGGMGDGLFADGTYDFYESFNDGLDGHLGDEEDAVLQMMMHQAGMGTSDNCNVLKRMRSINAGLDGPDLLIKDSVLVQNTDNNNTAKSPFENHNVQIGGDAGKPACTAEMDARDGSEDSSTGHCPVENMMALDQLQHVSCMPKSVFGEEVDPRLYKLASLAGYLRSMIQSTYSSRHVASGVPCISTKSIQACMMSCQDDADELEQCFSST